MYTSRRFKGLPSTYGEPAADWRAAPCWVLVSEHDAERGGQKIDKGKNNLKTNYLKI